MIEILDKTKCSGCNACQQICPKQCISMKNDEEGFWYPKVDKTLCIHCDLCNQVCPIETPVILKHLTYGYACRNKNTEQRKKSSSGGIFSLLAEAVIEKKGVVFGAKYNHYFEVVHDYAETIEGCQEFIGSKYVQSQIKETFIQTRDFLKQGRIVLFSGTPCQIEGLLSFLKIDYDNLITVDIACHGVPSPLVWKSYLRERNFTEVKKINHRSKKYGWQMFSMEIEGKQKYIKNLENDEYLRGFLKDLILRPSCYDCAFKRVNRRSDITLADFWGIRAFNRSMDDDLGVSLAIIQSDKGKQLFNHILSKVESYEVDLSEALKDNTAMIQSVPENENRAEFFSKINHESFCSLINHYYPINKSAYYKGQLRRGLSKIKNTLLK